MHKDLEDIYKKRIVPCLTTFELLELVEVKQLIKIFTDALQELTYLSNISEDTLWEFYSKCLQTVGDSPFKDFSPENKETFYRLKMRWQEEQIANLK